MKKENGTNSAPCQTAVSSISEIAMNWWYDLSDYKTNELIMKHKMRKPIREEKIIEVYNEIMSKQESPQEPGSAKLPVMRSLPAEDIDTVIEMLKNHAYSQEEMDECEWNANKMEHLDALAFDHAIMINLLGGALEGNDASVAIESTESKDKFKINESN